MDEETVSCSCTAAGDVGEIIEHTVMALSDPTDTRGHTLSVDDPPAVALARAERERLDGLRAQIEETTGLTAAEFAAAIRRL